MELTTPSSKLKAVVTEKSGRTTEDEKDRRLDPPDPILMTRHESETHDDAADTVAPTAVTGDFTLEDTATPRTVTDTAPEQGILANRTDESQPTVNVKL